MTVGTRLFDSTTGASYVGAGVLLMRLGTSATEAPRFLLLQGRDTGIWSFSKGHPEAEDGGNPLQTAIRETREETGYEVGRDYALLSDTSVRLGKRPYWIGVMTPGSLERPRLSLGEHSDCGWFTWSEVGRLPTNTDVRAWVKKATVPSSGFGKIMASRSLGLGLGLVPEPSSFSSKRSTHSIVPVCIAS